MQPRLKTSKKWTAFPKEYQEQIEKVFHENFSEHLGQNKLVIEGRIYPEEVMLRVGVNEKGRLVQSNFEVSMGYDPKKKDAVERIHNCIDAAASMMMDYFDSEGEVEFPRAWQEYPFQGLKIYLQYTTVNTDLEAQADALLGDADAALVTEEENEDALSRAHVDEELSAPSHDEDFPEEEEDDEDENDEDAKSPKMFGGPKKKKKDDLH
ncbi:hypothetical protein [Bdellovibrio sp. HCB337]|uniref:hypothetical protein n=1 Tax=Bdellovibrio sp. HCB337 TaxID=3394358 RepID=UPI0039A5BBB0